ncbi:MAG: MiaB/RimO family radical SAM methylthiotransferase [Candidatus Omnitrophica bacterium]|jgi:threonylcarbamoyladenosine tRNA methylthiotransferase MtaB|nr:MiaB/RimO family radical SAM methylthiotransferase [Candidatus Omnitrophota bacterium]
MKSIKFFTLGCKANQYDTQSIRERFLSKGFREDPDSLKPDYFLINTCTVTSSADQKSRNIIRRCIQSNLKAKVIVTGCLAEKDWGALKDIPGISLVVKKSFFPEGISSFSQHTRAFLKIQDGCDNFCTYCKVALVRGKKRSKSINQVLSEAKKLVACGFQEIVLTGICLGEYGKDFSPKKDLVYIIEALAKIEGLLRIRLSSIEAGDVSPGLIKCLSGNKKLCRHLHIPIQSGDNSILKSMNRKYTRQKYLNLIARLKRKISGVSITTDCLVGFPGETDGYFNNTVSLVKKILPLKTHIFPYSMRPGTKAAKLSQVVDAKTITSRCAKLEKVSKECQYEFMHKFIGQEATLLIEGVAKNEVDYLEGLTDNYLKVRMPFKPGLKNKLVKVRLIRINGDGFIGEYVDNL